jgi:hypothetical protein
MTTTLVGPPPTPTARTDTVPGANNGDQAAYPMAAEATVREAMIRHAKTCPAQATVADVRRLLDDPHVHAALLVGHDDTLVAVIERADLSAAVAANEGAARLGRLKGRTTSADAPIAPTREAMSIAGQRRLAVIDSSHRLLGLLCLKASGLGFCSDRDVHARSPETERQPAQPARSHPMTDGIPASELSDADLNRDLDQLERTRADIESTGTDDQKRNHTERSQELRTEAERRFGSSPASATG